ncbi:MAG: IclR family transcriptional regulator [Candidatus Dormiibacterota bacterium]
MSNSAVDEQARAPGQVAAIAPAVLRATELLDALAEDSPRSLADLTRRLAYPKSSILKICRALELGGLVRRDPEGYVLGQRVAELGAAYLGTVDEVRAFYQIVRAEVEASQTVQLACLAADQRSVVHLARRDGARGVRLASDFGIGAPATCTASGKAILASLEPTAVAEMLAKGPRLIQLTRKSHATPGAVLQDLAAIRQRGYAIDDEETTIGIVCTAAVIASASHGGRPMAVTFTVLKSETSPTDIAALGSQAVDLARSIAGRLGLGPGSD